MLARLAGRNASEMQAWCGLATSSLVAMRQRAKQAAKSHSMLHDSFW
jgi:hypothetical protein